MAPYEDTLACIKAISLALSAPGGLSVDRVQDWKKGVEQSVNSLTSRMNHLRNHDTYAKRYYYVLKQMEATLTLSNGQHRRLVIRSGNVLVDWSTSILEGRVMSGSAHARLPIPAWIDYLSTRINASAFHWDAHSEIFVLAEPRAELSLKKDGYRINSRHALALGVATYGPHRLGGQHF
ncbi:hypothetical protein JCM11491_002632 [Sporobolomyces phaffii]